MKTRRTNPWLILFLLLLAAIMTAMDVPPSAVAPMAIAGGSVGALIGGLFSGIIGGSRGWLLGLLTGVAMFLLV